MQRRRFSEPSEVRHLPHGRIDIVELDDTVVGKMTYEPGWRWSVDVKPIAGTDRCQYHHIGITLEGRLRAQMPDGTELEIGRGDVFEIPPGHDAWVLGDTAWVSVDFEAMRTYGRSDEADRERRVMTILFTDLVGSTAAAVKLGDVRWREVIAEHNQIAESIIDRQRGRMVDTTGDGVLAVFESAERAARAAIGIRGRLRSLDLQVRAGIHSGEVDIRADGVRGVAVHAASRIMSLAGPGEILVSTTTRDLLDGADLSFVDRGRHQLKGLSGERQVFAVDES
jgi:class 3 adenylate cyclase